MMTENDVQSLFSYAFPLSLLLFWKFQPTAKENKLHAIEAQKTKTYDQVHVAQQFRILYQVATDRLCCLQPTRYCPSIFTCCFLAKKPKQNQHSTPGQHLLQIFISYFFQNVCLVQFSICRDVCEWTFYATMAGLAARRCKQWPLTVHFANFSLTP